MKSSWGHKVSTGVMIRSWGHEKVMESQQGHGVMTRSV